MTLNPRHDIGYLHVLDYYLWRACRELAAGHWPYWHHSPSRYRDLDGDFYG